jgi:pimeloyl-ACP methyl ester carboxylesterase
MKKSRSTFIVKTKKYQVKDIKLNVAEVGKGKSLVLIHGWASSWEGWTLLAKELYKDYKIYMVDLPGFGDSDHLPTYSLDILSEYLNTFIDKYVPKPIAIIGASSGTFLAVHLFKSKKYDPSTAIILIGTLLDKGKMKSFKTIYSKFLTLSTDLKIIHKIAESITRHPYSAYFLEKYVHAYEFKKDVIDKYNMPGRRKSNGKPVIQLGASIMGYLIDEQLKTFDKNTLLIFGKHDRYISKEKANALLEKHKNSRLTVELIPKAGHSPAYEQPEKTGQVIREYLRSL